MEKTKRLDAYFEKEGPYREGLALLRDILCGTELVEDLKWGAPVYTLEGKNVMGMMAFKHHFGIWFFNGVFLSDPLGVLVNAQEGKTKAMRQWRFNTTEDVKPDRVRAYVLEAIANERKGRKLAPAPPRGEAPELPDLLRSALEADSSLKAAFGSLAPYKQRDFAEYIETAKQQATRERRLAKILPMIRQGTGLNDTYRKS